AECSSKMSRMDADSLGNFAQLHGFSEPVVQDFPRAPQPAWRRHCTVAFRVATGVGQEFQNDPFHGQWRHWIVAAKFPIEPGAETKERSSVKLMRAVERPRIIVD